MEELVHFGFVIENKTFRHCFGFTKLSEPNFRTLQKDFSRENRTFFRPENNQGHIIRHIFTLLICWPLKLIMDLFSKTLLLIVKVENLERLQLYTLDCAAVMCAVLDLEFCSTLTTKFNYHYLLSYNGRVSLLRKLKFI